MSRLWALTVRELKAFAYSPIGPVVSALFMLLQGIVFYVLIHLLNDPRVDPTWNITRLFFGTVFYWIALFITIPTLTMRTFSEEKRTGSIELLLTAPITDTEIVAAKFLGTWLAYGFLWLLTFVFFVIMRRFTPFDWGPVVSGYVGTLLLGGMLVALGVFASSLTRNQIISGLLAFVLILAMFSIGIIGSFVTDPTTQEFLHQLSLIEHVNDFSKGFLDTRPIVLYISVTAIALLLTARVIGSPRWRT